MGWRGGWGQAGSRGQPAAGARPAHWLASAALMICTNSGLREAPPTCGAQWERGGAPQTERERGGWRVCRKRRGHRGRLGRRRRCTGGGRHLAPCQRGARRSFNPPLTRKPSMSACLASSPQLAAVTAHRDGRRRRRGRGQGAGSGGRAGARYKRWQAAAQRAGCARHPSPPCPATSTHHPPPPAAAVRSHHYADA